VRITNLSIFLRFLSTTSILSQMCVLLGHSGTIRTEVYTSTQQLLTCQFPKTPKLQNSKTPKLQNSKTPNSSLALIQLLVLQCLRQWHSAQSQQDEFYFQFCYQQFPKLFQPLDYLLPPYEVDRLR